MVLTWEDVSEKAGTAFPKLEFPINPGSQKSPWPALWETEVSEEWWVKLEISFTNTEWFNWPEVEVKLSRGVGSVQVNNTFSAESNFWQHVEIPWLEVLSVVEFNVPFSVKVSTGSEI